MWYPGLAEEGATGAGMAPHSLDVDQPGTTG
jgi:hypothetical protein